jgi:restriction endonuclease Mrr
LIECKRYAPDKPISVEVVRGLYGVVESERATMGLIATTSFFSNPAKSFQAQNKYRLELADFERIKAWLSGYQLARGESHSTK